MKHIFYRSRSGSRYSKRSSRRSRSRSRSPYSSRKRSRYSRRSRSRSRSYRRSSRSKRSRSRSHRKRSRRSRSRSSSRGKRSHRRWGLVGEKIRPKRRLYLIVIMSCPVLFKYRVFEISFTPYSYFGIELQRVVVIRKNAGLEPFHNPQ